MMISEKKFWKMTPRLFISMLDEWWRIQRILHGQNPDEDKKTNEIRIGVFDDKEFKNPYKEVPKRVIVPNVNYIL